MSCEHETVQVLRASGHRLTPQRLMILSAVRHAPGHVTAAEILDQAKRSYPYLDVSTVYRTLHILKDMRLLSETDMGGGEYSYEWMEKTRHHHLICRGCDRVILLDHEYVERMGAEVLASYDFQPDMDHFAIFGLCGECRSEGDDHTTS